MPLTTTNSDGARVLIENPKVSIVIGPCTCHRLIRLQFIIIFLGKAFDVFATFATFATLNTNDMEILHEKT